MQYLPENEITIRAGWTSYIRAHGVSAVTTEPRAAVATIVATRARRMDGVGLQIERDIALAIDYPARNWYAVEGDKSAFPRQAKTIREDDPSGSWIQFLLFREYSVDRVVGERFLASRGSFLQEMDVILGDRIDVELRDFGLLGSGIIAAMLSDSQPSFRNSAHVYWWNEKDYAVTTQVGVTLSVVPATRLTDADLADMLRKCIAPLAPDAPTEDTAGRALYLAAGWLLAVTDLPIGSNERFIVYFQIVEALVQCFGVQKDKATTASFDTLQRLVREHAGEQTATLLAFLQNAKGALFARPIRTRFAALANSLSPTTAVNDIKSFDEMSKLRNELVHARIRNLPKVWRDLDVELTMRDLATTYFLLVAGRERSLDVRVSP